MHHIYETKSFVIHSVPSKEADKRFFLYTEKFGLITATAQGVREAKSKLRYSLQTYSLSTVNLVKGRSGWRITSARLEKNLFSAKSGDRQRSLIIARIFSLLRRMLQGEEPNPALFETLITGADFLIASGEKSLQEVELVFVLKILFALGYVGSSPSWGMPYATEPWHDGLIIAASRQRQALLRSVNESLRASHL